MRSAVGALPLFAPDDSSGTYTVARDVTAEAAHDIKGAPRFGRGQQRRLDAEGL